eukprot:TRINITY_DN10455_c0_g1_i1.p1 TRINITY_DN10455_c0_g1~~TRINITY_DN10455_c0_g1_i1.p1  ORF type:complete len:990 (+),score=186.80 TRINITY_DN10455_c0_g1_i1:63-3032(+)
MGAGLSAEEESAGDVEPLEGFPALSAQPEQAAEWQRQASVSNTGSLTASSEPSAAWQPPSTASNVSTLTAAKSQFSAVGVLEAKCAWVAHDERRSRDEFARIWAQGNIGGFREQTIAKGRVWQVILRGLVEMAQLQPQVASLAESIVRELLARSPSASVSFEESLAMLRGLVQLLDRNPSQFGAALTTSPARACLSGPTLSPRFDASPNSADIPKALQPKGARMIDLAAKSVTASVQKPGSLVLRQRASGTGSEGIYGFATQVCPGSPGPGSPMVTPQPSGVGSVPLFRSIRAPRSSQSYCGGSSIVGCGSTRASGSSSAAPPSFATNSSSAAASAAAGGGSAPMRASRASLETDNAVFRGALGSAQAAYDRLVMRAENLRFALARGGAEASQADVHVKLNSRRLLVVSLEGKLERYTNRLRHAGNLSERLKREASGLREDLMSQAQKRRNALAWRDETRDKLSSQEGILEDVLRKAKTEHLRAAMLREAFEQEQTRVGISLGRAETFVRDLVSATEGTRRVEAEEQSRARQCISELGEINAECAREEAVAEATVTQLRRELLIAHNDLSHAERVVQAKGADASDEAEVLQHSEAMELTEMRRRCRTSAILAHRKHAEVENLEDQLELLRQRSAIVDEEHSAISEIISEEEEQAESRRQAIRILQPRLRYEEAAEVSLRLSEERLSKRLANADRGVLDQPLDISALVDARHIKQSIASMALAQQHADRVGVELETVRSQLQGRVRPVLSSPLVTNRQIGGGPIMDSLEAAGLQRKLGSVLAVERQNLCRLQEVLMTLRVNEDINRVLARHIEAHAQQTGSSAGSAAIIVDQEAEEMEHARILRQCSHALRRTEEQLARPNLLFQPSVESLQEASEGIHDGYPAAGGGGRSSTFVSVAAPFKLTDNHVFQRSSKSPKPVVEAPTRGRERYSPRFPVDQRPGFESNTPARSPGYEIRQLLEQLQAVRNQLSVKGSFEDDFAVAERQPPAAG